VMKISYAVSGLATFLVTCASCLPAFILANHKKQFDIYRHPVQNGKNVPGLRLDGIYVADSEQACFYLYQNGKIMLPMSLFRFSAKRVPPSASWMLLEAQRQAGYEPDEHWGEYELKDSTISIQYFNYNTQEICKRWVFELKGHVRNDSTIEIFYDHNTRSGNDDTSVHSTLHFRQLSVKPDSTRAWYNNKKWYMQMQDKSRN